MFIRCEDASGLDTLWLNVSQIKYIEESSYGDGEIAGYLIHCIDNKQYYSNDIDRIKKILEG